MTQQKKKKQSRSTAVLFALLFAALGVIFFLQWQQRPKLPQGPRYNDEQKTVNQTVPRRSGPVTEQRSEPLFDSGADERFPVTLLDSLLARQAIHVPEGQKGAASCRDIEAQLTGLFTAWDQSDHPVASHMNNDSLAFFKSVENRLIAKPPILVGETDNLLNILTNTAHFYRVLGLNGITGIKTVLAEEAEHLEAIMILFYSWTKTRPACHSELLPLTMPLPVLYDYAGFFLTTLGGQSYLFRRTPPVRTLLKYYAVLILDLAESRMLNSHGIDIRPHLLATKSEIEVSPYLIYRDAYLQNLEIIQERYDLP